MFLRGNVIHVYLENSYAIQILALKLKFIGIIKFYKVWILYKKADWHSTLREIILENVCSGSGWKKNVITDIEPHVSKHGWK